MSEYHNGKSRPTSQNWFYRLIGLSPIIPVSLLYRRQPLSTPTHKVWYPIPFFFLNFFFYTYNDLPLCRRYIPATWIPPPPPRPPLLPFHLLLTLSYLFSWVWPLVRWKNTISIGGSIRFFTPLFFITELQGKEG